MGTPTPTWNARSLQFNFITDSPQVSILQLLSWKPPLSGTAWPLSFSATPRVYIFRVAMFPIATLESRAAVQQPRLPNFNWHVVERREAGQVSRVTRLLACSCVGHSARKQVAPVHNSRCGAAGPHSRLPDESAFRSRNAANSSPEKV